MELKGEYHIPAPRERVWAMLTNPDVLRDCIPGCQRLEKTEENKFAAKVTTKIGPVKATFNGEVELSNINAPESYTISGEGKGGAAGFASGGADVHLAPDGADATVLTYTANAKVGGKIAQLGSRLIDSTAKKLADQFFDCFAERASAPAEAEAPAPAEAAAAEPAVPEPARAPEPAAAEPAPQRDEITETVHRAEETLERKAAGGVLGGPLVWGLLVLAALIVIYFILGR
jgi:uncharacterized protein